MPSNKRRKPTNSMRNTLQRERSQRRVIREASTAASNVEAVKTQQLVARERARTTQRVATQQQVSRGAFVERHKQAVVNKAIDTATPSSDSNLIMVTIFTMGGLILIYIIVTSSQNFAGFLGGVQNWLHTLSSNTPLFKQKSKG